MAERDTPDEPREGEEIDEIMDEALPERLEDERIEEEPPGEPGLDAV